VSAPFKGQVRVLGDNVNTDDIIPGRYLNTTDPDELAAHLFEDFAPQLGRSLRAGEIIVAGENFGCGSSREHAPIGLKARGVACVVAGSFARIFFRNALNIGLPILECPGAAEACSAGDEALVDVAAGTVTLGAGGRTLRATPLPDFIQKLIRAGGLIPYVATKIAAGNREPG
jgi:3-isopropylmalate/(R)-2-methylmalate dehydratase small subunit